jgi:hypothetical protein
VNLLIDHEGLIKLIEDLTVIGCYESPRIDVRHVSDYPSPGFNTTSGVRHFFSVDLTRWQAKRLKGTVTDQRLKERYNAL